MGSQAGGGPQVTQPAGPTCCGVAASAGPGPGAAQRSVTSEICAGVTVPAAARCTSAGQQGVLFSITARPPPAFHTREKAIWGQGWKVPLAASLLQLLEGSLLPPGGSRLDGACRPPPRPAGTGVSPKLQGQAGWWRFPGPVPRVCRLSWAQSQTQSSTPTASPSGGLSFPFC